MLVDATDYGRGEVFDAGTGISLTVNQVANMVLEITNSPDGQIHHPMRVGEHEVSIVARGDGWDLLGWKPEFCIDTFTKTVEWYREYAA